MILWESDNDVNQTESTSTNSLPQLEPGPSYTVQAVDESLVAAPSARSHLNVSIDNLPALSQSLAMPSRRRGFRYSSHTDSSLPMDLLNVRAHQDLRKRQKETKVLFKSKDNMLGKASFWPGKQ